MIPGPIILKECSTCKGIIREYTLASGNTFGARSWTDGKVEAPMLPERDKIVKCPYCFMMQWVEELKKIGEYDIYNKRGDERLFNKSKNNADIDLDDYLDFAKKNKMNKEKEKYIRIRGWHIGNDKRRNHKRNTALPLDESETENMYDLYELLNTSKDDEQLMRAEIMRELGEFNLAKLLLSKISSKKLMKITELIKELIRDKNMIVQEIPNSD